MSRSIKTIIAGLCLALATTSTASAQISQMRLFSPFPDDQFGGGVYQHEGFYGSIGAGLVTLSQPSDQIVGSPVGTSAQVVTNVIPGSNSTTNFTYVAQTNQMNTSQFRSDWETATEFAVGNMIGHHGWEVKGTVITPQKNNYEGIYGGINIEDPAVVDVSSYGTNGNYYIWNGKGSTLIDPINSGGSYQIGRLWAIRGMNTIGSSGQGYTDNQNNANDGGDGENKYIFVPMPITYETFEMQSKVNTWSVEAMYNYRFHPFRRGTLELLAGIRYTQFDGRFNFFGHANTENTSSYQITEVEILETNSSANVDNATTSTSQEYGSYDYENSSTVGADLGYSDWNFEANNHIIGPQVGLRYTISNNRWRFTGEGKYFAGFNRQNLYGDGTLGLKAMTGGEGGTNLDLSETGGVPTFAPLNTIANSFAYSKHHDVYTNGVEGKFEATWNWTQAVGFKVGYQMLYMDNIARASAINDYRLNEDGTIFGVKKNDDDYNFDQFVHGVMFTVLINR
ncbi:MAG: BBP7 family outer membrane beta-barrel protein [Thermoguttaceae bacterium]|nr:BBP7 family outer membrane beta-barrel protein [Thermoguttaceae bacterium]